MKKLVVISILMAIMVGLSVFEIIKSTQIFSSLADKIEVLRFSVEQNEEKVDNESTLEIANAIKSEWEENKRVLLVFNNHSTVRSLDEKIVAMLSSVENGKFTESMEYSATALSLCQDLVDETHPIISNLF